MPLLFSGMSGALQNGPVLRLVNTDAAVEQRPSRRADAIDPRRAVGAVAAENRVSASLSALDARWVFAVQVARTLDGGKAAALPPERRRDLIAGAARMGLRTFDANLVIAIVQDAARRGESPLSRETEFCLKLVRAPSDEGPEGWNWMLIVGMALLLAGGALAGFMIWLRA